MMPRSHGRCARMAHHRPILGVSQARRCVMPGLVLSRKSGGRVFIGDDIVVTVVRIRPDHVQLRFTAPKEVRVLREEIAPHKSTMER